MVEKAPFRKPAQWPEDFHLAYILPVHNEAATLEKTLLFMRDQLGAYKKFSLLLIENGSQDNSFSICQKLVNSDSPEVLAFQEINAGIGYAFFRGIKEAINLWEKHYSDKKNFWILLNAADLPFGFTDLGSFLDYGGVDRGRHQIFIGSKGHKYSRVDTSILRKTLSLGYRAIRRFLLGMQTKDSQGSVFIHIDLAKKLINKIQSRNFFFTTELICLSEKNGQVPAELPVTVYKGIRKSTVKPFKDSRRMFIQTMKLAKRLREKSI